MRAVVLTLLLVIALVTAKNLSKHNKAKTLSDSFNSGTFIDGNSNEWWIQVVVAPGSPSKVEFIANGETITLRAESWDSTKRTFTGKPTHSGISHGTGITIVTYYPSGSIRTSLPYNFHGAPKYDGKTPVSGGSSPQAPSPATPIGKPPAGINMGKIVSQVAAFVRNTNESPAYVGGSENTLLKKWKSKLNNAISHNGVSDAKTRSIIHAFFALESETLYDSSGNALRDTGKDYDALSKNYSPLNMNKDMLNHIHFKGDTNRLNRAENINDCVATLLLAIQELSLDGFINFHRGGRTGYQHPNKSEFKIPMFKNGIYHMMQKFQQDTSLWSDGRKVWAQIDYV